MKEKIDKINRMALENFAIAEGMLDMLNDIYGTHFGWLNKRVVIFNKPEASSAEKYAHCYDAYTYL